MTAFLASEAAAIWAASRMGISWALCLLLVPAAGISWLVFRQRGRRDFRPALLMLCLSAVGLLAGLIAVHRLDLLVKGSVAGIQGAVVELSGRVSWAYESPYGVQYTVGRLTGPDGRKLGGLLLVDGRELAGKEGDGLSPGDRVELIGQVALIEGRMNPGAFDARSYWFLKGVHACLEGPALLSASPGSAGPLKEAAWAFSSTFKAYTDSAMGECVSNPLMDAIALSDKSELDPRVSEAFRQGGLAHVMSASGLHVSIVIGFVSLILGKSGASGWASLLALASVLPVYAIAAGLRPSIIRACITGAGTSAKKALRLRGPDQAGLLLAAASIQLMLSPMSLFDPGFQMSYLAVISIMAASAMLRADGRKTGARWAFLRYVRFALSGSLMISAALLPLTSSFYGHSSLLSPLANIVAIPLASLSLAIGLAGYLAHLLSPGLGFLLAVPAKHLLMMLDSVAGWMSGAKAFLMPTGFGYGIMGLLYLGVMAAAWLCLMGRLSARRLAKAAFVRLGPAIPLALAALIAASLVPAEAVTVRVISVGQGDSILISKGGSFHMLVDTGPGFPGSTAAEERILPALRSIGVVGIDVLALTHPHSDHTSGLEELASGLDIGMTLVAEGDLETAGKAKLAGLDPVFIRKGGIIESGGLAIESVNGVPFSSSTDDANEPSMVLMVEYMGHRAILCADAGGLFEAGYDSGPVAFLKVGHHGSSTSSSKEFLEGLGADYAAISVGTNFYGHPSAETVARIETAGASWMRTDRSGMITVTVGPKGIYVSRESDSWGRMPFFRALKEVGGIGINPSLNVK